MIAARSTLAVTLDSDLVDVSSLAEARRKVLAFVGERKIDAASYGDTTGRITRDGTPYARVSIHGRIWALDEAGRETYRAMDDDGTIAP